MAHSFTALISLEQDGPNHFHSRFNPERMGNTANIAYGGCTLAVAVNAAYQSVTSKHYLYSVTGNYLGPALIDRNLQCSVRVIRDTSTFATRQVEVSQVMDSGQKRNVLFMVADFQAQEKGTLLEYSAEPSMKYSKPDEIHTMDEMRAALVQKGVITQHLSSTHKKEFQLKERHFNSRQCPEGVMGQTLLGILKTVQTTQEGLPITSRTSADWSKSKEVLNTPAEQLSAAAFVMDAAISFVPLAHAHMFVDDAAACSTLDFALRFFCNAVNLNEWHLREYKTIAAAEGRTYSEARLWDERGAMVAIMTQQCILRPKPHEKAAL